MKLRIAHKFFLALLVTTGLGIAFMALAQRYTFERGLLGYAQEIEFDRLQFVIEELEKRYESTGSWTFVTDKEQWLPELIRSRFGQRLRRRDDLLMLAGRESKPRNRERREWRNLRELTPPRPPPWWGRISLLNLEGKLIAGAVPVDSSARRELQVNGSVVGYLALAPLDSLSDELDLAFARQQMKAVFWAAVIALVGAVLAAALLARSFGSPIRALARGTHALAGGRYETRLDQSRKDELGRLAVDFNGLAAALQQTREARQQWVADISHELRTPVAVLQAELETLEDGLRPLDRDALRSLSAEVKRLRLLVDDLHQLARSDSGALTFEKVRVDLAGLLKDAVDRFHERASASDLSIEFDIEGTPAVFADADRLRQLIANLMENSLRYTDAGGVVRINLRQPMSPPA